MSEPLDARIAASLASPTVEHRYRVWVEKFQWGWVTVTAPSEDIARDRAQKMTSGDWHYPEESFAQPLTVERVKND